VRLAILVHPTRDVRRAIETLRSWADERGAELVQLDGFPDAPRCAPPGSIEGAELVLAVGGDGTVLAAVRAAAPGDLPVLGVACGSLGALTTVAAPDIAMALDRVQAGDWIPERLPALVVAAADGHGDHAINDLVVVRDGGSQVSTSVEVDGVLYGRFAGDGVIASTRLGSSAYTMAAGGAVLAPGSDAWQITPLAPHGGCIPPVVLGARSRVRLTVDPGFGGARVEVDGQRTGMAPAVFEISLEPDFATLMRLGGEEEHFTALRRRKILIDSPRVLARDARGTADAAAPPGPAPDSHSPHRPS
jgi:NAD+ kinase